MKGLVTLTGALCAAALATSAQAAVSVGGYNFNNNAFADSLLGSSGSYTTSGGSLAAVLTDTDPGTYAFSFDQGAYVDLGFTDNVVVNGAGNDLVLFELGVPDTFNVTINGVTLTFPTVGTGFNAGGFALNAVALNLDAFGLGAGSTINSLRLSFVNNGTVASTSLVGALNSRDANGGVPEPATWAMMITGFGLVGGVLRSRRRSSVAALA